MTPDETLPPEDRYFLREAQRLGFASSAQIEECLRAFQAARKQGVDATLPDILVKRDCITTEQAKAILRRMGREAPTLPGYEGLERIGRGGMGIVYRARPLGREGHVAIKVLYPEITEDPEYLRRFFREAQAARGLKHPNIVQGIAVGYAEPHYYCVMEYVAGPNLDEVIRARGPLPASEAVRILRHLARALKHIHAHGLIHRDIKPKNILIAPGGFAMLADLGLLKRVEDGSITQPESVMGSALYISPEQARGATYLDIRSDLYGLGATAFEMLAGRPPFEGKTAAIVLERKLREAPPDLSAIRADIHPDLARIVRNLLAPDRNARTTDPTELLEQLRRLDVDAPAREAAQAAASPPRRAPFRPWGAAAGIAAGLALSALAFLLAASPPGGADSAAPDDAEPLALGAPPPRSSPRKGPAPADDSAESAAALEFAGTLESALGRAEALPFYARIALDFPATPAAERAVAILDTHRAERADDARAHARRETARARDLLEAGRFPEAEAVAGRVDPLADEAGKALAIRRKAAADSRALLSRAEALAFTGSRTEAEAALRAALALALEPERANARRLLAGMAAWGPEKRTGLPDALRPRVRAFFRLLKGGHFSVAEGMLRDWNRDLALAPYGEYAEFLQARLSEVRALQAEALETLRAGTGPRFIRVNGRLGKVVRVQGEAAILQFGRREQRPVRPADLDAQDLLGILALDPTKPQTALLETVLFAMDGACEAAEARLERGGGELEPRVREWYRETLRILREDARP
ncbi:MAG: serine/threonine-protein kinase [Planctomycetota bacterium]